MLRKLLNTKIHRHVKPTAPYKKTITSLWSCNPIRVQPARATHSLFRPRPTKLFITPKSLLSNQAPTTYRALPTLFKTTTQALKATKKSHIRAVIFDIGGTLALPYCTPPEIQFNNTLNFFGISLPADVIRKDMGKSKPTHLGILSKLPEFQIQWKKKHKRDFTENDFKTMYAHFESGLNVLLEKTSTLIPGASQGLNEIKMLNIPLAATSGFQSSSTEIVMRQTQLRDKFDTIVSANEATDSSRSGVIRQTTLNLNIAYSDLDKVIFITDSANDIRDVKAKLPWVKVVGVSRYSTHMGISNFEDAKNMSETEICKRDENAANILKNAGADVVIHTLSQIHDVIMTYELQLAMQAKTETASLQTLLNNSRL